jgi:hypothetical protein
VIASDGIVSVVRRRVLVKSNPPPSLLAGPQWVMPDPEAGASDSGPNSIILRA